jgi:hypothetical protein
VPEAKTQPRQKSKHAVEDFLNRFWLAKYWQCLIDAHDSSGLCVRRPQLWLAACWGQDRARFFCTSVHRFAQTFAQNLIDGAKAKIYLARRLNRKL